MPGDRAKGSWKRPKLKEWRSFTDALITDAQFEGWYGPGGLYARQENMGFLTGSCSGGVIVLDLDVHKKPQAKGWWDGAVRAFNAGLEPDTLKQTTGGGGRQLLFRAPATWGPVQNLVTSIGVDVRGQGGFAMLPPSLHESGQNYHWDLGPDDAEIAAAPEWLLDEIERLRDEPGSRSGYAAPKGPQVGPQVPGGPQDASYDAFGHQTDGRELRMRDIIWRTICELFRTSIIQPHEDEWPTLCGEAYERYEAEVSIQKDENKHLPKRDGLEKEDRGPKAFWQKWRGTMRGWGSEKMKAAAAKPNPKDKPSFDPFDWEGPQDAPKVDPNTGQAVPLVVTAAEFVAGFVPPVYTVDGVLRRGCLYALTARMNHGKTAVSMYIMQCVARGVPMHSREVERGTVLLLAGENPDDIRARFLVLAHTWGFAIEDLKVGVISGVVSIAGRMAEIQAYADSVDDLVLVIVDTAAAYFPGDNTNDNAQQLAYAKLLRQLTFLNGKPTVLVNAHPIKNAAQDNLLPMGGSAFVNEIDGNLILWTEDRLVKLHWLGKVRGPDFEPTHFELQGASSPGAVDGKGREILSVVAVPISDLTMEAGKANMESDENRILMALVDQPGASFVRLSDLCGFSVEGRPQKTRVARAIDRLKDDKLVVKHRRKYRITKKGAKEVGREWRGDD
jgi:hypothetical protein